jgi:hypothetical protein
METFVLRIWVPGAEPATPPDPQPIRGTVEHVSSGGWVTFRDDDELLGLIRDFLQQRDDLV